MKANQIITTLAELVSKIECLYFESLTTYPSHSDEHYAKLKTAALVHAAQELERLSEEEKRAVWDSVVDACDTMLQAEKKLPNLPHIPPITTKLHATGIGPNTAPIAAGGKRGTKDTPEHDTDPIRSR